MSTRPDWVVVVGDVNSTMAAAIVAKKLLLPVAHLEAGLRSFDRTMPEEINRIVTDSIADLLWTPSPDADANLSHEGIPESKIERVGNIMIDAFEMLRSDIATANWPSKHGFANRTYGVVTLHRPANVDDPDRLAGLVAALERDCHKYCTSSAVTPANPRTAQGRWPAHAAKQYVTAVSPAASRVYRIHECGYLGAIRADRLRRYTGGNDLSGYPMSHSARYY